MARQYLVDITYFFSIVGAFLFIVFTSNGQLQSLLGIQIENLNVYYLLFSFLYVVASLEAQVNNLNKDNENDNSSLSFTSQLNIALGLIIFSTLSYALQKYPQVCSKSKISHIAAWFLLSRLLLIIANLFSNKKILNVFLTTFANTMTITSIILSMGLASGFDTFLLL